MAHRMEIRGQFIGELCALGRIAEVAWPDVDRHAVFLRSACRQASSSSPRRAVMIRLWPRAASLVAKASPMPLGSGDHGAEVGTGAGGTRRSYRPGADPALVARSAVVCSARQARRAVDALETMRCNGNRLDAGSGVLTPRRAQPGVDAFWRRRPSRAPASCRAPSGKHSARCGTPAPSRGSLAGVGAVVVGAEDQQWRGDPPGPRQAEHLNSRCRRALSSWSRAAYFDVGLGGPGREELAAPRQGR